MLGPNDITFIDVNGWIMDHDWELLSCLLGEPFLFDMFLCFFDGSHVSICAWPIEQDALDKDLSDRVLLVVQDCVRLFSPRIIEIWGPQNIPLDPVLPRNFNKIADAPADDDNINLQISYADYNMPNNKNYHNAIQSERSGVHYRISSGLEFTWQHFSLIERFLSRNDLTPFDKVFNVVSPCVARSQRTTTFEAYKGDELLGFSIVRETLKNVAIATWAAYKNNPLHPSDFLNRLMISHYKTKGVPFLDLGYSIHKELLAYKRRWGANVNNGGYYNYSYAIKGHNIPSRYWHWWARDILQPLLQEMNES